MLPFRFFIAIFTVLLVSSPPLLPSEDCTNQRDDDQDGLIDCFDPDCDCNDDCLDFYYSGCESACTFIPNCDTIALETFWVSQSNIGNYPVIVVGDLDADGLPEVVTHLINGDSLFIIDGQDGVTKYEIKLPTSIAGGMAPAIGDIDLDGMGEIILVGNDRHLYCYEHNGDLKYATNDSIGYGAGYRWSVINLADVDYDGSVEIIIGNQVYSAIDGTLLASGGKLLSDGHHPARDAGAFPYYFPSPVIVDALPDDYCADCSGLEIVAGNQVLSINLDNGAVLPQVQPALPYSDGYTSIADFDLDGDLDAIIQGKVDTQNTVYVWDIQTPTVMHEFELFTNVTSAASRANVADIDGDGLPEISFVSRENFYALDNDFSILWTRPIFDPSAVTVSSVFDFCGNGAAEIIYRDQDNLYIFDGPTGDIKFQTPCKSATHIEMPVIVDVDADGQTEMLITCGPNPSTGNVIAFKSANSPWSKSRPVWNQHAFFNTNINDDLSIPIQQQNPNIVNDSIVMNTFLNQYSNPVFPLPDLALIDLHISCLDPFVNITFQVCNNGDASIPSGTSFSYYDGNPTTMNIPTTNVNNIIGFDLAPEACGSVSFISELPTSGFIYVVLNDDRSLSTPFNIENSFPVTNILECNYSNNILGTFVQNPNIVEVVDTLICVTDSLVIENIALGADTDTTFTFLNSNNCDSLVRYIINTIPTPLNSEEITFCSSDSVLVFGNFVNTPGIYQQVNTGRNGCDSISEIILIQNASSIIEFSQSPACSGQENGSLQASVIGDSPPYFFSWNTGATTDQINDLPAGLYTLTVTDFLGCRIVGSVDLAMPMITPPILSLSPVSCPGEKDGSLLLQDSISGFRYAILSDSFQSNLFFNNLSADDYILTIQDTSDCLYEFPFTISAAEEIQLEISEDQTIGLGEEILLRSYIFSSDLDTFFYQWSPEVSLNCLDCPNPVATPITDTEYELVITNSQGCTAEASVLITINSDKAVYIPNAFSPNADGINDHFVIHTNQSVQQIQTLQIYNRWGAVIYENAQFPPNDFLYGWDGTFKGQALNPGVYVYVVVIDFVDQTTEQYSGDLTIFR